MKLHYNNESFASNRHRKIRAVVNALGLNVEEVAHDSTADLSSISPFNTLPLLQTQQGTFFSSNTIVRFLANSQGKLYGTNNHQHSLVDQWLDVAVCELEAAVAAVAVAAEGKTPIDANKVLEDVNKFLTGIEAQVVGKKFLVGDSLTIADISLASALSVVFAQVLGEEERKAYPNLTAWYLAVAVTDKLIGSTDLPKEAHKLFKGKKTQKKEETKEEKKEEKKPANDEDDLFGDDEPAKEAPKPKPQVAAKPKKEKPAAKSMILFDVKVYEMETDLIELFKKITTEITIDGLVWNNEPKILPIAFGMNKLQVGCVVEDAKVSVDDIYERIEAWEDLVQSTDTVSFQKL